MSRVRVPVEPELFEWARLRSGIDEVTWSKRFPQYESWLAGEKLPTLKQLEVFARMTYAPIGFLLLDDPPVEEVPIPDFRSVRDQRVRVDSANLLDTIYVCQARQEWYRDHQLLNGEEPLSFVGVATTKQPPSITASSMKDVLGWSQKRRHAFSSWADALTNLREAAEGIGVLVMISGIVGSNTRRKLNPREFRGFSLVDEYASLVFVNGADSKAAQIFTLAHELAHVWLGQTGLSDVDVRSEVEIERWCNEVAAEFLVPMSEFRSVVDPSVEVRDQLQSLAERFRVSTEVILARFREADALSWSQFMVELSAERERVALILPPPGSGGNYYYSKPVQVGKRFARELIASTLEGSTPYTEAFRLLELKKTKTLVNLGEQLGVA